MAEASGLAPSQFILDDTKGFNVSGIVYLPSRQVVINSGGNASTHQLSAVFNTLIINNAHWTLDPYDSSGSGAGSVISLVK